MNRRCRFLYYIFIPLFIFLFPYISWSQEPRNIRIDSLQQMLKKSNDDTTTITALNNLSYAYYNINPDSGILYGKQALALSEHKKWKKGAAIANSCLGINCKARSDYPGALTYYLNALKINEALNDKEGVAANLGNIGLIYQNQADLTKALDYHLQALKINEERHNNKGKAANLANISNIYEQKDDYARALNCLEQALKINTELDNKSGIANNLANIGTLYSSQQKFAQALAYDFRALRMDQQLNDKSSIAVNLGNIGEIYYALAKYPQNAVKPDSLIPGSKAACLRKAISFLEKGLAACSEIGFLKGEIKFNKALSKAYAFSGNDGAALAAYVQYATIKDSVFSEENNKRLKQVENRHDAELKDKDILLARLAVEKKRDERTFFMAGIAGLLLVIGFIIHERRKSETLLLNILPEKIANRLKKKEHPIADHFLNASIMFIDMAGFTIFAENRDPKETVSTLNEVFTHFDALADKHGLEKIKTIGDCYMAVAGLPEPRMDHSRAATAMALEIKETMKGYVAKDGTLIHFRIGLDCGSVVAGVIGKKKFIYDLWGDAVNTASRMESSGVAGEIHCTDNFKQEIEALADTHKIDVTFTSRGEIEIRSKGMMQTWFIS